MSLRASFSPLGALNCPIYVSSFFRSKKLNKAAKGSSSSTHMKGEAMDLDADVFGKVTNAQIFHYIKDNLEFDQLIWEFERMTSGVGSCEFIKKQ
jgi:hypothetical protein